MTLAIKNDDQVLALRALRSKLMGKANPVLLPNFDGRRLSWPVKEFNGLPTGLVLTPKRTRNRALDGTIYEDPEIPDASEILAHVQEDANPRATTLVIHLTQGGFPVPGQQFGLDERLYEIVSVADPISSPGGSEYEITLTIYPPLRDAAVGYVSSGGPTQVLFTRPVCQMRCMNLNDEFRKLDNLRFATLNLEFLEYF